MINTKGEMKYKNGWPCDKFKGRANIGIVFFVGDPKKGRFIAWTHFLEGFKVIFILRFWEIVVFRFFFLDIDLDESTSQ